MCVYRICRCTFVEGGGGGHNFVCYSNWEFLLVSDLERVCMHVQNVQLYFFLLS